MMNLLKEWLSGRSIAGRISPDDGVQVRPSGQEARRRYLLELLSDRRPDERRNCILELRGSDDHEIAQRVLDRLLFDEDPSVRYAAVDFLRNTPHEDIRQKLLGLVLEPGDFAFKRGGDLECWKQKQYFATLGLQGSSDPGVVDALYQGLSDPRELVVRGAARALKGTMHRPAVDKLLQIALDFSRQHEAATRETAILSTRSIPNPVVDQVMLFLVKQSDEWTVRRAAVHVLETSRSPLVVSALAHVAEHDAFDEVRTAARSCLDKLERSNRPRSHASDSSGQRPGGAFRTPDGDEDSPASSDPAAPTPTPDWYFFARMIG